MIVCAVSAKALRGPPLCRGLPTWPVGLILRVVRVPFLFKCVVFRSTFRDRSSSTHFGVLASVCGVRTLQSRLLSFEHFLSGTMSITSTSNVESTVITGFRSPVSTYSFRAGAAHEHHWLLARPPLALKPHSPSAHCLSQPVAASGPGTLLCADARRLQRPDAVVSRRGDVLQSRNRPRARLATCSTLFCKL